MSAIVKTIKDNTMRSVVFKLVIITILNALDGILTYISLYYNYATEENPLVDLFIHDFGLMMLFKIFVPTAFIAIAIVAIYGKGIKKPVFVNSLVTVGLMVYVFILLNHFYVLGRWAHYLVA